MQLLTNDLAFIGLGSNIGDCLENLKTAVQLLERFVNTPLMTSSVYRSEPVEVTDQPWFYNQVVGFVLDQPIGPLKLLQKLKEIEATMGRTPGPRYGPRVIDMDLLFYKNWVYECDCLRIPHPKLENRSFVLRPLAEIAPDLEHPYLRKKIGDILEQKKAELSFCEKIVENS